MFDGLGFLILGVHTGYESVIGSIIIHNQSGRGLADKVVPVEATYPLRRSKFGKQCKRLRREISRAKVDQLSKTVHQFLQ